MRLVRVKLPTVPTAAFHDYTHPVVLGYSFLGLAAGVKIPLP